MSGRNGTGRAANETSATLANTSTFNTLEDSGINWKYLWKTQTRRGQHLPNCMHSDDPRHDRRGIHGQLWNACQRNWLHEAALEDAYVWGLPQSISFWRSTLRHLSHLAWTTGRQSCATWTTPKRYANWNSRVRLSWAPFPSPTPPLHPSAGYSMLWI